MFMRFHGTFLRNQHAMWSKQHNGKVRQLSTFKWEYRRTVSTIFLSYTGTDRTIARKVAAGLRSAGIDLWWDQEGIGWGDDWIGTLDTMLSQCDAYLILIGATGIRRWLKAELSVAIRRHFDNDETLPIFPLLLEGVPPKNLPSFLAIFQARTLPKEPPQDFFDDLAKDLLAKASEQAPPAISMPPDTCPFPGLEAFTEEDAPFFFGRQREVARALHHLGRGADGLYRRWLQIEGPSGIGKSSLVRAGILPAIKAGWAGASQKANQRPWCVLPSLRPGVDPIENLAWSISTGFQKSSMHDVYRQLQDNTAGKAVRDKALRHLLPSYADEYDAVLLVVDQLEEIFTLTEDQSLRETFDALLSQALEDPEGPLHLITTVRSDFLLRFSQLPGLHRLLNESTQRIPLGPLDAADLKVIIERPTRLAGLSWSEPSLPERIVEDALGEPGALPLIENVLLLLWQKREGNVLCARLYRELGGVGGALSRSADTLLNSLGKDSRERAMNVLMHLVRPGYEAEPTRRTIPKDKALKAAGGGAEAERILARLSGQRDPRAARSAPATPRLIVISNDTSNDASPLVDLAHEILLRKDAYGKSYWQTFRDRIDDQKSMLEDRDRLERAAVAWNNNRRPWFGGLASGRDLRAFRRVGIPSELAAQYLRASLCGVWLRRALYATALVSAIFYLWIYREGMSLRMGTYRLLAHTGIYYLQPEMVVMREGTFRMGDLQGDDPTHERPVHDVTIRRFALGKYEVTFDEYELFARLTNRTLPSDEAWGKGRLPVINVSWKDAVAYAQWLSERTGKRYRLPTEAEWEYAARAETGTRYWWGDEMKPDMANCRGCLRDWQGQAKKNPRTSPVGSFKPNAFSIYDMAGNVLEWVADCWQDTYDNAPNDGSAWSFNQCSERVLRGGSWSSEPKDIRLAFRTRYKPNGRFNLAGFRLAQDL